MNVIVIGGASTTKLSESLSILIVSTYYISWAELLPNFQVDWNSYSITDFDIYNL